VIPPGSSIGILGGGQLGRMLAIAARQLGYRIHTLAPEDDTPTGQVADVALNARYDDLDAVRRFSEAVDVVTFEFENVSAEAAAAAEAHAVVRPSGRALYIAQQRVREKTFLAERGLPVTPFAAISDMGDVHRAAEEMQGPGVLKTAAFGYDGKGQIRVDRLDELPNAWAALGNTAAIFEAFIDLDCEISVIGVRGAAGEWSFFGPVENAHRNHILDVSVAPARVSGPLAQQAVDVTRRVMEALDYIGVLCVEFFVARDGRLMINELAPRPHNSGHLTIDACRSSQFEQHARAICGLPLGSPELLQPAAMANVLGDVWGGGEPDWAAALAVPDVKLHLYGKRTPRPGRKMGHLTALAATADEAKALVLDARARLERQT